MVLKTALIYIIYVCNESGRSGIDILSKYNDNPLSWLKIVFRVCDGYIEDKDAHRQSSYRTVFKHLNFIIFACI